MKRNLLIIVLLTIFSISVFGKHIDENTAKQVGRTFLVNATNSQILINSTGINLVYKASANNYSPNAKVQQNTFFYVFNVGISGFVIVAADDNVTPILGYSDEGAFDPDNIPQNAKKWFEEYKSQIRFVIDNKISATKEIQELWTNYLSAASQASAKATSVNPLVQTKWNQSPYYNALCPGGSVSGCVATAMAQIMKYWNYPATGSGFHSYNHQNYGTLSANFGSTSYQWSSMSNVVNSSNSAVATLMYHCGVSVDMNYSPQSSGAYVISVQSPVQHCSEYALKTYFGYKNTLQGVQRSSYNQTQWINLLKTELNANRPILYAGFGSGGGHCFVADGYDNNDYIHFNWGWGGSSDGYFQINALNPGSLGTGGGTGGFNSGQHAVIGIEPPTGNQNYNMALYNYVNTSSSTIYYGQSFNITTNIANNGTGTFNGDYCAAIFDNQYNFIDYVNVLTGNSLQGGYAYTNNLMFSTSGLFSMLPGTYYIVIFYRPTGGNWIQVSNSGSYTNFVQMNVINPNNIELNSSMNVNPGTTLIQGQSASVNLNIINKGGATFYGQYQVNLYKLDGSFVQTIGTINENVGLPYNYTYISPYLNFNVASINANPGTYLLAVSHKPNNSSNWQLTGSSFFQNPIKVTVQAASLAPDQYENNNSISQAYTFPISFSGNMISQNTFGSNLHTGTDNDFYKINLPSGYDYTVTARLHDRYNSGNGNIYSVDGLFSYSTDGSNWSDTYDDVMSGNITFHDGGTLYFHVAPYFSGENGTYLLDMSINRETAIIGIEETEASDLIKIYPNPAREFVYIDLNQFSDKVNSIHLLNAQGKQIHALSMIPNSKKLEFPLQGLSSGVYLMQIQTIQGILTKKIVITP